MAGIQVSIPITGPSYSGRSTSVNAQEAINMVHVIDNSSGKAVLSMMNRPSLVDFSTIGASPIRGMIEAKGVGYVVSGNKFYSVLNDGTYVTKGALSSNSGTVGIAFNGYEVMVVDGSLIGYIYDLAADTFLPIASLDFLGGNTVTFMDQYFIVNNPNSGIAQSSGILSGTSWNALDVAVAENDPDNLSRVLNAAGDLWMLGETTAEPYYTDPTAAYGFPFSRRAVSVAKMGLAARWSAVEVDGWLYFAAQSKNGFYGIIRMYSGGPQKISTPALDYQINTYSTILDAIAMAFTLEGHPYYVITFPTANKTWVYDVSTSMWAEWRSGTNMFKCGYHMKLNDRHILGDLTTGKLYEIKHDVYADSGEMVERIRTTSYLHKDGREITINKLWIEQERGVGLNSGQGSDPMIMLQWSKNNGKTWSSEQWRPLGKMGEYGTRAIWTRLGSGRSWIFRRKMTDPVKDILIAAYAEIEVSNN